MISSINNDMDTKTTKHNKPKIIKWVLIAGIVIVLNLFFAFAIKVIYDEPQYDQFCENKQVRIIPDTQDSCVALGGQWTEDTYIQKTNLREGVVEPPIIKETKGGYCNPDYTCRQDYQSARDLYERNVFVALVVIGVLLIIGSLLITGVEVLSLGFSLGGVLALIIGSMRFWSVMDEYLRVGILGVALIALIWVAVKKFKD